MTSVTASAGASAEPPAFDPGTIIVEDDFDTATAGGAPDAAKWEAYESWEQVNAPYVDATKAHSGSNSVRLIQGTGSGRGAFLVPVTGFPVAGNVFYVRAYIQWEKATSTISGHSGFIVGAVSRDNSGTELRLGISSKGGGGTMLELNLQNALDGGEVSRYSNGFTSGGNPIDAPGFQFDAGKWYCIETLFGGAASGSEFRVWIDGSELDSMHVTDFAGSPSEAGRTMWAPTFNYIKIGNQTYDAELGNIWYDDVIVSTGRAGCLE